MNLNIKDLLKYIIPLSLLVVITLYLLVQIKAPYHYNVLFSPDNKPKNKIVSLIKDTDKSIRVAVYNFTEQSLADELIEAKNRGVKVSVITDQSSIKSKHGQMNLLRDNGIEVFVYPKNKRFRSLMHHKFALFNKIKNKKYCCTGSLNWTNAACKYNQENVLITDNEEIYNQYSRWFNVLKLRCSRYALE